MTGDLEKEETNGPDNGEVARNSTLVLKALNSAERPDVGQGEGPKKCSFGSPGPPFLAHTDYQLASGNLGHSPHWLTKPKAPRPPPAPRPCLALITTTC